MKLRLFSLLAGLMLMTSLSYANRVRVVHASPDAPAVDIWVDGQKALESLPFGEYTDYVTLQPGQRTIDVAVAGTTTVVLTANPYIQNGVDYTVLATGFAGGNAPALDLLLLIDRPGALFEGKGKVRVVHTAPSAPAVDVYFTSPYMALDSSFPVLESVPFRAASGYLIVPTGDVNSQYQARVAVAGTKTVAIDSGRVLVPSNSARTYVAMEKMTEDGPVFHIIELLDRN